MSKENNINLTKGVGEDKFIIPENAYSKGELVGGQLDYELVGGSEKAESKYDHNKSETAKESAEADRRVEAYRRVVRLKGQKVLRAIRFEDAQSTSGVA